jgi:RNA polymerase sigma-70 factor, ECF subfamily
MSDGPTLDYEAALLDCAAGDGAAAAVIYRGEADRLKAVAKRILRNRDQAEDVIHDAFVQILRDARGFDPQRGSARAWIYTIVRNTALKRLRRHDRELVLDPRSLAALQEANQPLDPPATAADYADLARCLDALPAPRRASLILAIIDGHTHAEIAAYLGVPLGTVKSWIRRELVALREQLK